ncbi:MAG: hypothetical protein LCH59_10900 [Proteobacteria bacterium]|nr:hypothetical protein [Pseudomonadota bacterium]
MQDTTPEKHLENAKQAAAWSVARKEYTDWLDYGDFEEAIKDNEVQACADLPEEMFNLLGEIHAAGGDKDDPRAWNARAVASASRIEPTVLQRFVDEMDRLIKLNDDGESDPTAPARRPKPPRGEDGPGFRP